MNLFVPRPLRTFVQGIGSLLWGVIAMLIWVPNGISQTTFGQTGTILTPSAETQTVGSFAVGGYFRSVAVSNLRFDETPVFLTTGINADMEVGFSFPSVWNKPHPPAHFENHSLISFKYRVYGKNGNRWRSAVSGLAQRSPLSSDTAFRKTSVLGLGWINSYGIGKGFTLHSSIHHLFTERVHVTNRDNLSLGLERYISPKVQFTADLYAVSNNLFSKPISVSSLYGVRYFYRPNVHFVAGGGIGINKGTADWQYLVGVSITASPIQMTVTEKRPTGLVFPLDPTDVAEQPLMEVVKGVPPPPGEEETPTVAKTVFKGGPVRARLFFDRGKFTLNPFEKQLLSVHCADLSKLPSTSPILISGHADPLGQRLDNRALSFARSLYVVQKVVTDGQIAPNRVVVGGAGEERPIDQRSNEAVDQLNRWVEIESNHRANAFQNLLKNGNTNHNQNGGTRFTVEYQLGSGFDYPGYAELGAQLRNAAQQLGALKSNEVAVLDVQYAKDTDYRLALLAACEQMVLLSQITRYQADQLYFRITSNGSIQNQKSFQSQGRIKRWSIQEQDQTYSVEVHLQPNADTTQRTVGLVMVIQDSIFTMDHQNITLDQLSKQKGTKLHPKQPTILRGTFSKRFAEPYQAYFLLWITDSKGSTLETIPLVQTALLNKWKSRFPHAIGLNGKEKMPSVMLQMQLRKVTMTNGNSQNHSTPSSTKP